MKKTDSRYYSWFIILAGTCWGFMGPFVRILESYGFSSLQISCLRLVIGAILIWAYVFIVDRNKLKIDVKDLPIFAGTGLLSVLLMSWSYFNAIIYTSLSTAAILLYTAPIWVLTASVIFYHEKITTKKIIALFLAFGGCICVSGLSGTKVSTSGILFGLCSGFAYSMYSIIGKKALMKYHPFTVTVYSFLMAAVGSLLICNLPQGIQVAAKIDNFPRFFLEVIGIAFITVFIPYLSYTIGLSHTPAGKAAIMASVEPLVATVAGMIFYKEIPGIWGFLGIIMIVAAILLLNFGSSGKK